MKKLISLILLLPLSSFAQVTQIDETSCSTPTTNGPDVVFSCSPVINPPPPEPEPAYSRVVAFGDSWTDDDRYTPWAERLANDLGIPITNFAVSGARSWQIEQQVAQAVSQGIDPDALYTYWIFPNDFYDYPNPFSALPAVEQNAYDAFEMLVNAGAQNILILSLPDGENYPLFSGFQSTGTQLTDGANNAVGNAAVQFGLSMYDSESFLNAILDGCGSSCWWDQQHMAPEIHDQLAQEISEDL